jgi:hypothetical protein
MSRRGATTLASATAAGAAALDDGGVPDALSVVTSEEPAAVNISAASVDTPADATGERDDIDYPSVGTDASHARSTSVWGLFKSTPFIQADQKASQLVECCSPASDLNRAHADLPARDILAYVLPAELVTDCVVAHPGILVPVQHLVNTLKLPLNKSASRFTYAAEFISFYSPMYHECLAVLQYCRATEH